MSIVVGFEVDRYLAWREKGRTSLWSWTNILEVFGFTDPNADNLLNPAMVNISMMCRRVIIITLTKINWKKNLVVLLLRENVLYFTNWGEKKCIKVVRFKIRPYENVFVA